MKRLKQGNSQLPVISSNKVEIECIKSEGMQHVVKG